MGTFSDLQHTTNPGIKYCGGPRARMLVGKIPVGDNGIELIV